MNHDHDMIHEGTAQQSGEMSSEPQRLGDGVAARLSVVLSPEAEAERKALAIRQQTSETRRALNDPRTFVELIDKVSKAIVEGRISKSDHDRLLAVVACKRQSGKLKRPGAYWCKAVKLMFDQAGVKW